MFVLVDEEDKVIYDHNYRIYSFTGADKADAFVEDLEDIVKVIRFTDKLLLAAKTRYLAKVIKIKDPETQEYVKKPEKIIIDTSPTDDAPLGLLPNGQPRKRKFGHRERKKK